MVIASAKTPPFQEVDLAVKLQKAGTEEAWIQVQQVPVRMPEKTLIPQVVDGDNGFRS